ncbi:ribosome biogenesis factor YjgA [Marinomonas pollencensis]|uniref:Dual-action ribosomal maturation protein DarP n=1 Tax=Marinomonas pollencensis TaxID=491954 RepID=A0A3E0DI96_9GAMM|nr:ribosome biogenesis factor YjgA [Marinomonas pollencensis]REG81763.1 ribosome-associated protein [Marinomonas pollencensis]
MTNFDQFDDDENFKSKTQIKREMEELQELGKKLLGLSKNQQKKVEMSETLREALAEADRIKQREAMRRHMQYIGKVMRTEDHESIARRVAMFDTTSAAYNKLFHQLELKRDTLIGENSKEALAQYLEEHPEVEDIQLLRQLIRLSQKEVSQQGNTTNRKKLFRFLRETEEKKLGLMD